MILNENYILKSKDRNAFRYPPKKKQIQTGTQLFRLVTLGENYVMGPYWFDASTLRRIREFVRSKNTSMIEIARSLLAVKPEWNKEMNYLCGIKLEKSCYGWEGLTKYQKFDGNSNVLLMGNCAQIFLPNLSNSHARIAFFSSL